MVSDDVLRNADATLGLQPTGYGAVRDECGYEDAVEFVLVLLGELTDMLLPAACWSMLLVEG
jgi:hypothetical protein